jgi:UDP-N-acetylmuramate--alanine ligase
VERYTYSLDNTQADFFARDLQPKGLGYRYTVVTPNSVIPGIDLPIPGLLNVENSLAAVAISFQLGLAPDVIARALLEYQGVERRFDVQVQTPNRIYIDDYAHHPTEIRAFLTSLKELFPHKRLTGIFQPHLFTRTRDFADEFARSLEMLDELILMEIYPAREEPIPGVTAGMLLERVNLKEKVLVSQEQLLRVVKERNPELLVTMGAGDINQFVTPLKEWFLRL